MATIKSFTDLSQSKVLAKILRLESADMCWSRCTITDFGDDVLKVSYAVEPCNISQFRNTKEDIPCWSLAALYAILPNNKKESTTLSRGGWKIDKAEYLDNWWCEYEDNDHTKDFSVSADNPIDACYEMVLKLHERKML